MKTSIVYIVACFLIAVGCRQDDYVRDYPLVVSSRITINTSDGVTVDASLGPANREKIIDHGFVWDTNPESVSLGSSFAVHLGTITSDSFSAEIKSQLRRGVTYSMRAYLKTNETVVYGPPMSFVSQGSAGPVIYSASPSIIAPGTIITIKGERFGTDLSQVKAFLVINGVSIQMTIKTLTDTEITAIAPNKIFETGSIVVQRLGNDGWALLNNVNGKRPIMTGITASDNCSPIEINGTDLLMLGQPTDITVNDVPVTPLPAVSNTSFTLPASYHSPTPLTIKLTYGANSFSAQFNDPAPMPAITSAPTSIGSGVKTFVIQGTNLPVCGGLTIVSDGPLSISGVSSTQINVNITGTLCYQFKFSLLYHGKLIYTSGTIDPPPSFTITSVSPLSGSPGDQITITGTNLDGVLVSLLFDGLPTTGNSTEAIATVRVPTYDVRFYPPDINLQIAKCGAWESYTYHLDLLPIAITDVNPKTNDGTQEIVLAGTNFLSDPDLKIQLIDAVNSTFIADLVIDTITDTQVTLFPPNIFSGSAYVSIYSYGRYIYSPQIQFTY